VVSEIENLCDLMFEVSNEDRLRIVRELGRESLNITGLSRRLDITTQEVSRHISRLSDVGLTNRSPEGLYSLTPYGELTLKLMEGLEFTSRHRDYFRHHTVAALPPEIVSRLGELSGGTYIDDVMVTVHRIEETIKNAEEYILNLNVPYIASAFPLIGDVLDRGVECRFIRTEDLKVPEVMMDDRENSIDEGLMQQVRATGQYAERLIDQAPVILYMSEKEVAILTFPLTDGEFDFHGFTYADERMHGWCMDLFNYYWEMSREIRE
jgi:predicted transcriptional regulator